MINQSFEQNIINSKSFVELINKCETKDESGLNDFQKLPVEDLISIPRVGINRFRMPIKIKSKLNEISSHDATASMYVSLNAKKNGISMSRLCSILQTEAEHYPLDVHFFKKVLARYIDELSDEGDETPITNTWLKISFNYGLKQKSLKSDNWGWQYYPVTFTGKYSLEKGFQFFMSLEYEYSSTCPCSLSMAKQYEREFAQGLTTEGVGIGVAHGQRSSLQTTIELDLNKELAIEDYVLLLRAAIPTETQSLVKRVDEQAFAILNGAYPIFVEHAAKEIYKTLNSQKFILDWIASIQHFESLHSHNAVAVIYKGISGGLNNDQVF